MYIYTCIYIWSPPPTHPPTKVTNFTPFTYPSYINLPSRCQGGWQTHVFYIRWNICSGHARARWETQDSQNSQVK